ncbi:hypothetical protein LNKW23_04730 [Paralimibaculum aggregatum]|uniref:VOC domain-containing protein n=1 Tax=Paralimibaculum aggregatum TaxID=3036245 RepID=A0ABQ6LGC3_9RHOB|nr:hypothetical protein LNKW23_04730 [Limibaculum sp. NKW23]
MELQSSIPVLRVAEYPRAREFYTGRLGFTVTEEGGEPPRFGIFWRGRAQLFLDGWHGAPAPSEGWAAYLHVADARALAAELAAAGVAILSGPLDTEYGLREVEIADSEGNRLCFGQILDDDSGN